MQNSGEIRVLPYLCKSEKSMCCGNEMRQRNGVSRGSRYGKANKLDMGGVRQVKDKNLLQ